MPRLPGKQGKDCSKVTRSHWEALSSCGLLGCPPSDLGYFGNCAARTHPSSLIRGRWLLTMTFSQGIVSLMSLLRGTSPNCLRASSVWVVPSALWELGPGSPCIPTITNCGFPSGGDGLGSGTLLTPSAALFAEHRGQTKNPTCSFTGQLTGQVCEPRQCPMLKMRKLRS